MAPGLWSTAELQIGVLSGNLPSLKPLFQRLFTGRSSVINDFGGTDSGGGSYGRGVGSDGFSRIPNYDNKYRAGSFASRRQNHQEAQSANMELQAMGNGISVTVDVEQTVEDASFG